MTVGELAQIVKENNIPEDAVMLSDSGWECSASDMDGVYYNKETNELVFTQNGDKYERYYYNKPEWKLLYSKEEQTIDQSVTKIASTMNVPEAYVRVAIDNILNPTQLSHLKSSNDVTLVVKNKEE